MRKFFDYKGKLNRGESLAISEVPYSFSEFGRVYQLSGDYWGSPCNATGRLEMISMGPGGDQAHVLLKGTDHPELRQWAENTIMSHSIPEITVHLCPANCPKTSLSRGSMHGTAVETEDARASYGSRKDRRSRERTKDDWRERERERARGSRGAEDRVQKKRKIGGYRLQGNSFGWEDKISIRQLLKRRSKKKKKSKKSKKSKKRKHSHSGSSRSGSQSTQHGSSSSGGSINSEDSGHPFREGHRIKQLGKRIQTSPAPLLEAACDVEECSSSSETRVIDVGIFDRSAPAAQHSGALGIMIQRVKAIELVLNGATWPVAQNIELVPLEQEIIASVAEAQGAARKLWHENRVQREVAGKGFGKWRWTIEDVKGKQGDGKKGVARAASGEERETRDRAAQPEPIPPNLSRT